MNKNLKFKMVEKNSGAISVTCIFSNNYYEIKERYFKQDKHIEYSINQLRNNIPEIKIITNEEEELKDFKINMSVKNSSELNEIEALNVIENLKIGIESLQELKKEFL